MHDMKKFLLMAVVAVLWSAAVCAQSNVGINTTSPDASSVLDLTSTNSGFLVPRMILAQRNAIAAPATGLLIYQTDNSPQFYYWNSAAWVPFVTSSTGWSILGNTGTTAGTNFLGTTDNVDLRLRTNNVARVAFGANTFVGFGQLAPSRPFELVVDNATGYTAGLRTASSETGVLAGCLNDNGTYGSIQGFSYRGGSTVAAPLALQPTSPGKTAGNVGVSMPSVLPQAKLDINGDLALRKYDTTAVDTTGGVSNDDYNVRGNTFVRITGPTHQFKVTGLAGGVDGRIVTLFNATPTLTTHTGMSMVIVNNSASSTAANRILTLNGADIVSTANASVSMIYSTAESKWIVFAMSK
jgi:hypothetical protein